LKIISVDSDNEDDYQSDIHWVLEKKTGVQWDSTLVIYRLQENL